MEPEPKSKANWVNQEGIPCSVLAPKTKDWQSGRVRVKIEVTVEFCPDDPESLEQEDILGRGSLLDDLRVIEQQ